MRRSARRWIPATLAALASLVAIGDAPAAEPGPSAVILVYHRFGEDRYPSTNTPVKQFETHLRLLREGGHEVLPLARIVEALRTGAALPARAVAITVDDAYRSVHDVAWPMLRRAGFPFTVFVATQPVARGYGDLMGWDQLRALAEDGVAIGTHSHSHASLPGLDDDALRDELTRPRRLLAERLGVTDPLFAYPYGEHDQRVRAAVAAAGHAVAFGQQSGVAHAWSAETASDPLLLPRFPMNTAQGAPDRFRRVINALPLPLVFREHPAGVSGDRAPRLVFEVPESVAASGLRDLACYASGQGRVGPRRRADGAFEVAPGPFPRGRARINCTLPARGPDGLRWRWFGLQTLVR